MKTSAFIAFLLAAYPVFCSNYATTPETLDCRKYVAQFAPDLSATQLVEQDLLHGFWTQETPDGIVYKFHFYENGTANRLQQDASDNLKATQLNWQVENWNGKPVLTLQEQGVFMVNPMQVEQTCDGMVLTSLAGSNRLVLSYSPLLDHAEMESLKASLEGDWTNVSWSESGNQCNNLEDQAGSFLNFRFNANGTYIMACGNDRLKMEESGTWDLSKDGRFIFFQQAGLPLKVAKIAGIDEHGMVLEHSMNAPGFSDFFCSDLKSFTFIR
ncbi:MAG: hypothetical protein H6577_01700 [Lewinellaceae bacterium]|nr:hypothetical protein [Saprospiraceae bacterium]MCB9336821.1 hypothetical protein [Lewinellaceae bacterium]